jgi:hypothetical protein
MSDKNQLKQRLRIGKPKPLLSAKACKTGVTYLYNDMVEKLHGNS